MTYLQKRNRDGWLLLLPYSVAFFGFIVLPVVVSLVLSFLRFDLTDPTHVSYIGLSNYKEMWNDPYFWQAFGATWHFVWLMVPSLLIVALSLSYGMYCLGRGQSLIRGLIFVPGMFTIAVTGILWQWFYELEFGLLNYLLKEVGLTAVPWLSTKNLAMPSIVIMSLWWIAGGTSVILLTALQQIPIAYFEAARMDGCNARQLFRLIALPQLRPVLMFVLVTNTIGAFQMFPQAYLLTSGGPENSTRGLVQMIYETAFNNYRLGYAAAISWTLTAIIAFFALGQFLLLRRDR